MSKVDISFKSTGKYLQVRERMHYLVCGASGYLPVSSACKITTDMYIEIIPQFNYKTGGVGKIQTGWRLIFVKSGKDGVFRFYDSKYPESTLTMSVLVSKKKGKRAAADIFTDALYERLIDEDALDEILMLKEID